MGGNGERLNRASFEQYTESVVPLSSIRTRRRWSLWR